MVGIFKITNPPINATTKKIDCLIKKYVGALLYLKIAATEDEEKTIIRPMIHKSIIVISNGLSNFANVFFIFPLIHNTTIYTIEKYKHKFLMSKSDND